MITAVTVQHPEPTDWSEKLSIKWPSDGDMFPKLKIDSNKLDKFSKTSFYNKNSTKKKMIRINFIKKQKTKFSLMNNTFDINNFFLKQIFLSLFNFYVLNSKFYAINLISKP